VTSQGEENGALPCGRPPARELIFDYRLLHIKVKGARSQ